MEKKMYVTPDCEVVELEIVSMIATSQSIDTGDDWENGSTDDANRHRGQWGNLWD